MRIYLIGAGHIARAHAVAAHKLQVAFFPDQPLEFFVADPFEGARQAFADENPNAQFFDSPEALLAAPPQDDDIVIVCTPPFLHRSGALLALKSGRHTLIEKPLAMNDEEAEQIARAAREAGKHFGDCSMRLYDTNSTREVRRCVEAGDIGTPYHISHVRKTLRGRGGIEYQPVSKWFLSKAISGGGPLMDWGVYDIAMLTAVIPPVRVEVRHAWMSRPQTGADPADVPFDIETHAGATLVWYPAKGSPINISYERSSATHGTTRDITEIEGTTGALTWDWAWGPRSEGTYRHDVAGELHEEKVEFVDEQEEKWGIEQHDRPLFFFYRTAIRGENLPALIDAQCLFNFRLVRAMVRAAETGEAVVVER